MWALNAGNHTLSMHFTSVCLPRPAPGPLPRGAAPWAAPPRGPGHSQGQGQPHNVVTFSTKPRSHVWLRSPSPFCSCGTVCVGTKAGWLQLKEQLRGSLGNSAAPVFGRKAAKQNSLIQAIWRMRTQKGCAAGITPHIQTHSRLDTRIPSTTGTALHHPLPWEFFHEDRTGLYEKSSITF